MGDRLTSTIATSDRAKSSVSTALELCVGLEVTVKTPVAVAAPTGMFRCSGFRHHSEHRVRRHAQQLDVDDRRAVRADPLHKIVGTKLVA